MTMHSRTSRRGRDQQADEFISQASAAETVQLHCLIPKDTHRRIRMLAVQEDSNITSLVIEALDILLAQRG